MSSEGAEESEPAAALPHARLLVRPPIRLRRLRIGLLVRLLVCRPPSRRGGGLRGVTRSAGWWRLARGAEEPRRRGIEAEGGAAGLGPAWFGGAGVRARPRRRRRRRGAGAEARGESGGDRHGGDSSVAEARRWGGRGGVRVSVEKARSRMYLDQRS
jgi:hypothetical protein